MTEEKEVVPETNGEEENDKAEVNGKKSIADEVKADKKENDEELIDLDAEIIRQVEHYFGDGNLPRDRFLCEQIKLDNGWVPLEILTSFNRLSKLSSNIDVIESALKKSQSGILEVADKKVRRHPDNPVPEYNEERRREVCKRTVYAKGFPRTSTLDELLKFYKKFDGVENIIMRRYLDPRTKQRLFKGSVFITFKTREEAEKCVDMKGLKYKDTELLVMWQDEYTIHKREEIAMKREKRDKKVKQKQEEKPELILPTGTVLAFENSNGKLSREDIKSALVAIEKDVDIAFIDFKLGQAKGHIRFSKKDGAIEFSKLLEDGNIMFGDDKVTLRLIEGDEEKEYLVKTAEEMSKRRKNMKAFKQNKGRNNYKGKHMKRRRDQDSDGGPPAKVKCDS